MNTDGTHLWMLLLLGKSVVICLSFLAIGFAFRHSSAAVLRMLWRGAVISLLAVIVVSFGPSLWRLPLQMRNGAQGVLTTQADLSLAAASVRVIDAGTQAEAVRHVADRHISPVQLFLWFWAAGAVLILSRFGLAALNVRRLVNRAKIIQGSADSAYRWGELLRLMPDRSVPLLVSEEVQSPFVAGVARTVIMLPKNSETWSVEECRAILRHELGHVENRDLAWQSFATVILALLWVNPFAWLIRSRLLKAQEGVADDTVLGEGMDELVYAETLSKIAMRLRGFTVLCPAAPMARQSTLGWRVARILDRSQQRGPAGSFTFASLVTLAVAVALTLGVAGVQAFAAEGNEDGAAADSTKPAGQPVWTRKYRDTFQLKPSFAERFPGTPGEVVAAIRKDLAATAGGAVADLFLEVSEDKKTLTVEFPEKRAREVDQALRRILERYSSWDELLKERQQLIDRFLKQFRDEVEKQRQVVLESATEAAKLRQELGIIDSDVESPVATTRSVAGKTATSRYLEAKARYLNSKKILEAAELRYSTERMKAGGDIGPRD